MKHIKIILETVAVLAIVAVAAININFTLQSKNLSAISLANVEALANGENNNEFLAWGVSKSCPGWFCPNGGSYTECEENGRGNSCAEKGNRTCTCGTNCNPCN